MAQRKFRLTNKRAKSTGSSAGGERSEVRPPDSAAGEMGRGADFNDVDAALDAISGTAVSTDPEDEASSPEGHSVDPGTIKPRRGRPLGSKTGGPKVVASFTPAAVKKVGMKPAAVESVLVAIHGGIAALLQTPELAIDTTDAVVLREALEKMSSAFGWGLSTVSPKTEAVINAAIAASIIYYPRLRKANARVKADKQKQRMSVMPNKGPQQLPPQPKSPPITVNWEGAKAAVSKPIVTGDAIDSFLANDGD